MSIPRRYCGFGLIGQQGSIPQCFIRDVIKLLHMEKNGMDEIGNFQPLTMLNTELKILASCLQAVLSSLIGSEGQTIQNNFHLFGMLNHQAI